MAVHSNIPAWEISWTEEPGALQSIGLQRIRHDWAHVQKQNKTTQCRHTQVHTRAHTGLFWRCVDLFVCTPRFHTRCIRVKANHEAFSFLTDNVGPIRGFTALPSNCKHLGNLYMASAQASPHAGEFSLWGMGPRSQGFVFFLKLWTGQWAIQCAAKVSSQGSTVSSLWTKSGPQLVFVNKVLLECSHIHLTHYFMALSRAYTPAELHLFCGPLWKKFGWPLPDMVSCVFR